VTSESYNVYDIVVVPFPYADRLAEKRRPALVVSAPPVAALGMLWVVMITSADNAPWACDVPIGDLERAGLPVPSVVRPAKLTSIEPSRVLRRAGTLDRAAAKGVARWLRGAIAG
jgi:mRNA interferase MazF